MQFEDLPIEEQECRTSRLTNEIIAGVYLKRIEKGKELSEREVAFLTKALIELL